MRQPRHNAIFDLTWCKAWRLVRQSLDVRTLKIWACLLQGMRLLQESLSAGQRFLLGHSCGKGVFHNSRDPVSDSLPLRGVPRSMKPMASTRLCITEELFDIPCLIVTQAQQKL